MNSRRSSQAWVEGNWYQPTALVAPPRYVTSWVLLGLALGADTVAFYSVVAKVLLLSAALTITLVVGLTAIAVGMSGEIGRDLRRRKASDPSRNVGLLWICLGGWLGLGVVGTLARILYGARGALGQTPTGGSTPEVFAGLFFAVLYFASGIFAIMAVYRSYNPAVPAYWRAVAELETANEQVRLASEADERARRDVELVRKEISRAPHQRKVARITTRNETTHLQLHARQRMAATVEDDDGSALELFMKDAPQVEDLPSEESAE